MSRTAVPRTRDRGSAFPMLLAFIMLAGFVSVPLLSYATTILRASDGINDADVRIEAAKAGLRVALADPVELYKVCDGAGLNVAVDLASPGLATDVASRCYKVDETLAEDPTELRYGNVVTRLGAAVPADVAGSVYVQQAGDTSATWVTNSTTDPVFEQIWLPNLPGHALDRRGPNGYGMEGDGNCRVYFPGTYVDPVVVNQTAYFTSGVYYFENLVEFRNGADAVIGGGNTSGCTNDQDAAFYTQNPPARHNMSGLGATFVFGGAGRMRIDNDHGSNDVSVVFNQRYVADDDEPNLPSAGVSIMTVNGWVDDPFNPIGEDLVVSDEISVPLSAVGLAATPADPITQEYFPSTHVHEDPNAGLTPSDPGYDPTAVLVEPGPILDVDLDSLSGRGTLVVPGYVAVPQGRVWLDTIAFPPQTVSITGGILAAQIDEDLSSWSDVEIGLVNPVVQKVFLIISETSTGATQEAESQAVVQINESGAYAINSWQIQ